MVTQPGRKGRHDQQNKLGAHKAIRLQDSHFAHAPLRFPAWRRIHWYRCWPNRRCWSPALGAGYSAWLTNGAQPKPATRATRDVNALYPQGLPFNDTRDFEDARRGHLGSLPEPVIIRNNEGVPVWDATAYTSSK